MGSIIGAVGDTDVIWIWVTDAMSADTLHDPTVASPVLGPLDHVVVRELVDRAVRSKTLLLSVRQEFFSTDELYLFECHEVIITLGLVFLSIRDTMDLWK